VNKFVAAISSFLITILIILTFKIMTVPKSIKPKVFGGLKYDSVRSICLAPNGYLLAGMTTSSGIGYVDAYILSLNEKGEKKWENTFGGKDDDRLFDILNNGNGYAMCGYTNSYGLGLNDFYLINTDYKGNLKFSKTFGGKNRDEAYSIALASEGGYVIAGLTDSFGTKPNTRLYVVKTDADGDCVWTRTFGNNKFSMGASVINAADRGYIVCGSTNTLGNGKQDLLLLKIDSGGNTLWVKTYGGKLDDVGNKVILTKDKGYAIIGSTVSFGHGNQDLYLIKTDAEGDCVWSKTYGGLGMDQGVTIINSDDGGYVIGATSESFSYGSTDLLVMSVDALGNSLWSRHFGGKKDDYLGGILNAKDGGYAIAGWTLSSDADNYDAYFLKLTKNGDF